MAGPVALTSCPALIAARGSSSFARSRRTTKNATTICSATPAPARAAPRPGRGPVRRLLPSPSLLTLSRDTELPRCQVRAPSWTRCRHLLLFLDQVIIIRGETVTETRPRSTSSGTGDSRQLVSHPRPTQSERRCSQRRRSSCQSWRTLSDRPRPRQSRPARRRSCQSGREICSRESWRPSGGWRRPPRSFTRAGSLTEAASPRHRPSPTEP